jgi:hypothetical protein
VFTRALVLAYVSSLNLTPLSPTDVKVLSILPDADVRVPYNVHGYGLSDLLDHMMTSGYKKELRTVNRRALACMQFMNEDGRATVTHFMGAYPTKSVILIRQVCTAFGNDVEVVDAVLRSTSLGNIKTPRRGSHVETLGIPARGYCNVCMEEHPVVCCMSDVTHTVCLQCLDSYVQTTLYGEQKAVRKCVLCPEPYGDDTLRLALGLHYRRLIQLECGDNMLFCKCGYGVEVDSEAAPSSLTFLCPSCGASTCTACKQSGHAPYPCGSMTTINDKLSEAIIRVCPCGKRFVKEAGCNKMTCPCGRRMCYICRQEIRDYDHFCKCPHKETCRNCHIYTDAGQRDEEALKAVAND